MQRELRDQSRNSQSEPGDEFDAFECRMHDWLDRRLDPQADDSLRAQAAIDSDKARTLKGQELMLFGLELSEAPAISPGFAQRCIGELQPLPARQGTLSRKSKQSVWAFASVVAGLLLLAIPIGQWLYSQPAGASVAVVESGAQPDAATSNEEVLINPTRAVAGVRTKPTRTANAEETATAQNVKTEEQLYEELYAAFKDLRSRATDGDEDLLALRPQWMDDMAGGLRPVADSVGGAINTLRRNIPPSSKGDMDEKPQALTLPGDSPVQWG